MIYMSVFSWISSILSVICLVWLLGLAVFVIIRKIVLRIRVKKEIKKNEQERKEASK